MRAVETPGAWRDGLPLRHLMLISPAHAVYGRRIVCASSSPGGERLVGHIASAEYGEPLAKHAGKEIAPEVHAFIIEALAVACDRTLPTQRELHVACFACCIHASKRKTNATDQAAGCTGITSACRLHGMHTGTRNSNAC